MAEKLICFPFVDGNLQDYIDQELTENEINRVYNGEVVTTKRYPYNHNDKTVVIWKPREEIELTLTYKSISRGRSSAKINWIDGEGHEFPMFLHDLDGLFNLDACSRKIHGIFRYIKRGCNFGIQMVKKL